MTFLERMEERQESGEMVYVGELQAVSLVRPERSVGEASETPTLSSPIEKLLARKAAEDEG